tara:strand:+ start:272 stop:1120 length:849 start_codon:yes stop_codon:yes gene_type:complete
MSDINKVKELRKLTGAGFKDCNLALKETSGNLEKATEILRVKGITKASKKMTRDAKEGVIVVSGNSEKTSIIEINCETDFVAKNDNFILFAKELGDLNNACESNPDKLKNSLMKNKISVNENLIALISKIGEKITIGRNQTIKNENCKNFIYQHSVIKDNVSKLAVITSLIDSNSNNFDLIGKQISMHIAASSPISIDSKDINKEIIDKETQLIAEELKNSGKADDIINKISEGKIKKFMEENSLLTQDWVMEPKKKVKDILIENGIDQNFVKEFVRFKIGE